MMGLSHQELLKCCISILDGFNDDVYAIENRVEEFFSAYEDLVDCDAMFIKELFAGCVRYKSVLNVVLRGFYNSDGQTALCLDDTYYRGLHFEYQFYLNSRIVVTYLFLFRLEELGVKEVMKYVKHMNLRKLYLFLNFLLNEKNIRTWMKDEWNKLYDFEFVQSSILQPLLKFMPELQKLLHSVKMTLDNSANPPKNLILNSVPAPFDLTPEKPKKVKMPEQIHVIGKHKPVPPTTYEYPKDHEALDQAKENNRKVSQNRYRWIQRHATSVMSAGKSQKTLERMQQLADVENGKLSFEGCVKPPPPPDFGESVPVKHTASSILREERLYKLQEEALLKKIEKLEAGEGDEFAFLEWQARMRRLDRDRELEEFERRRLGGLLSQEQSIISRQKLIRLKQDQVAEMKAEACQIANEYMRKRLLEEEKLRRLIAKSTTSRDSARYAKQQMQLYKAQIVQAMNDEYKEMMRQAVDEAAAELQQKIELIHQIRALQAVPITKQPKVIDFTFTSRCGLLCEMSIAELHERLQLMQIEVQKQVAEKREQINQDKQAQTQRFIDKIDTIEKHRREIVQAAAVRSDERKKAQEAKMRPLRPRNEMLTKMERTLEQRRAERQRLEAELRFGLPQVNKLQSCSQRLQSSSERQTSTAASVSSTAPSKSLTSLLAI